MLIDDPTIAQSTNDKIKCLVPSCLAVIEIGKIRQHIGKHILKKDIAPHPDLCSFCGKNDNPNCKISLKHTSGKGQYANYGPDSKCVYFKEFNFGKSTKNTPCTNRPVICPACEELTKNTQKKKHIDPSHYANIVYWSYNLEAHYDFSHAGFGANLNGSTIIASAPQIPTEEVQLVLRYKD